METLIIVVVYVSILGSFAFNTWLSILNYQNRSAEIPEEVRDVYDPEKYKVWFKYNMENFKFSMVARSINLAVFLGMLVFGLFIFIDDISRTISGHSRIQILIFMGFYFLVTYIIGIFTSYYQAFKIEEKYGFNRMTKKTFVLDKIKSLLLTIVFGGGLLFLIIVLSDRTGNMFYLYTWLALVFIFLLANILYVSLIVPIFNKLVPLEDGELKDEINVFAKKVGYEVSKISVMDASRRSSKLNAYFAGFGRYKKIVLYDTLINKLSTQEIVAVLAHEIGHNKHKHILYNLIIMSLTLLVYVVAFGLLLNIDLFSTSFGFDSANFGFSLILFMTLLEPISIILGLLTNGLSRKFEYQADAFAATKYSKDSMINALKVLTRENFSNLTPHPLFVKFLYTHPPVSSRIRSINSTK